MAFHEMAFDHTDVPRERGLRSDLGPAAGTDAHADRRRIFRRASRLGVLTLAGAAVVLAAAPACGRAPAAPRIASPERAARPPAAPASSGYALLPAEKNAVQDFLRANRDLRMATDDDRRPSESDDLEKLYGVYHPYFLRGDVNDDGILDFVLAFVKRDSDRDSPWFSVVVFSGKEGAGFSPGTFIERDVSLADGDLSIDRDSIVITPDLDDEQNTRRYRWDPIKRSYIFVTDDAPEDGRIPAAQT